MKKAFITGISGQTGSYLAEFLLEKGYEVHGLLRRSSLIKTDRIDHIFSKIFTYHGDLTDSLNLYNIVNQIKPDEIYNLAAQSHVKVSFETPEYTSNADGLGTLRLLEIIKNLNNKIKFYQASTSELFGNTKSPQNENSKFEPRSPYAVAKLYSYWLTRNYREAYKIFAVNGILFNHEGPRRGETFISRKVSLWCANWKINNQIDPLEVGNMDSIRDWTDARDMVRAIYMMMQHEVPDDFVVGSSIGRSVRYLIETSLKYIGINLKWSSDFNEGFDLNTNRVVVKVVNKYFRPLEVNELIADTSKVKKILKWEPSIKFEDMIAEMIENDFNSLSNYENKKI